MNHLKPKFVFDQFTPNFFIDCDDRFDIRKIADNLLDGKYNGNGGYYLQMFDYSKKSYYDRLPRQFRYHFSEKEMCNKSFGFECFYNSWHPIHEIYIDYCQEFYKQGYENKSVERLYKKLKNDHPECFI